MVKKYYDNVKPFSSDIGTCRTDGQTDGRTDRRTDRQTDGQNCYINIARQCADAMYVKRWQLTKKTSLFSTWPHLRCDIGLEEGNIETKTVAVLQYCVKVKGKGLDTCYSATYISQTRDQQRFTISEVAADWHEPMVPQRIMWPSIARANGQLDPRCS